MNIMDRIIDAHGKSGVRAYNQLRFSLSIIGPVFISIGIIGLLGHGTLLANGEITFGSNRTISCAIFVALGIISQTLRLTIFKKKR